MSVRETQHGNPLVLTFAANDYLTILQYFRLLSIHVHVAMTVPYLVRAEILALSSTALIPRVFKLLLSFDLSWREVVLLLAVPFTSSTTVCSVLSPVARPSCLNTFFPIPFVFGPPLAL